VGKASYALLFNSPTPPPPLPPKPTKGVFLGKKNLICKSGCGGYGEGGGGGGGELNKRA